MNEDRSHSLSARTRLGLAGPKIRGRRLASLLKLPMVEYGNGTLLIGFALVLFSWIPGPPMTPDQFTLPKDVALGSLGFVCAIQLVLRNDVPWDAPIDAPLIAALFWGTLLTPAVATNPDVAWRALGSFGAAVSLFLLARRVASESGSEMLYLGICSTLAVVGAMVLLEALGGIPFISEPGRQPGATLGNRNLVARLLCLSLPLLWRQMVLSDQTAIRCLLAGMVTLTSAVIVLSRSRGVWLVAVVLVIALPVASRLLSDSRSVERTRATARLWVAAVLTGAALAILLPNRLRWGPSELASSARRALDYRTGTGRGRVIQARTTWHMIRASPLQGVGPGNWSIIYPAYAGAGDPSHTPDALYPAPRIPRGDLLSLTAEFGLPGLALGLTSAIAVLARATAMLRSTDVPVRYSGLMLLAIGGAVALLGLVDPVVRLSPSLALLAMLTGLALSDAPRPTGLQSVRTAWRVARRAIIAACGAASVLFASRAVRDIVAFQTIRSMSTIEDLYRAVALAPNNLEARTSLAYVLIGADRCDLAELHLTQASRMQPFSGAVRKLNARCGGRRHWR